MTSNESSASGRIPAAVQAYSEALSGGVEKRHQFATAADVAPAGLAAAAPSGAIVDFVYDALTKADLTIDKPSYPVSGTFDGAMPPWLNDKDAVPPDWGWSKVWDEWHAARAVQVAAEAGTPKADGYIQNTVPGQTYTGSTTAEVIQEWYTQGMWDVSAGNFAQPAIDTLTQNWIADDQEFARQRLGGANPNVIKSADGYDIGGWIGAAANSGDLAALQSTLIAARSASGLYMCDYTAVLGTAVAKQYVVTGRFLAAPVCFFAVESGEMRPLAIQVEGTDAASYIFTPGDANDATGDAWLLAKLWTASADQQWWFSGSHLFNTHTIDMIFGIAALNSIQTQQLASEHPMVVLAKPFLAQVFDVNNVVISSPASAEQGIYQAGSFCDAILPTGRIGLYQVISDLWTNYDFDANAFPTQMANRGLQTGPISKVTFPYRDDGQIWWTCLENFVTGIASASYSNDAAVAGDAELNVWMRAVETAFNHDGTTRFTWTPTVAGLTSVFTNLLYLCSVQHTGVNDTMFDGWAFTPNGPFSMQAAPAVDAKSVSRQTVLESLPNPQEHAALGVIASQITFVMNGTAGVVPPDTLAFDSTNPDLMMAAYPYAAGSAQAAQVTAFWNAIWTGPNSVNTQINAQQDQRVSSWTGSTPVPNSLAYRYLSAEATPWAAPGYLNAPVMNQIQI